VAGLITAVARTLEAGAYRQLDPLGDNSRSIAIHGRRCGRQWLFAT